MIGSVYMKTYFPYDVQNPRAIVGEVHTIEDGTILLKHIPYANSIEIEGFVQTDNMVLLPHQLRCDYGTELNYRESSCLVYFNEVHNGLRVIVNYLCVGTIIIADDLNEIKAHLDNRQIHNTYSLPTASTLEKGGVRVGQNLQMVGDVLNCTVDILGHNSATNAHPVIQNLIADEIAARTQAIADLEKRISALEKLLAVSG